MPIKPRHTEHLAAVAELSTGNVEPSLSSHLCNDRIPYCTHGLLIAHTASCLLVYYRGVPQKLIAQRVG
ncbi:hypothetical protein DBB30_15620 [Yersinia pestis]|nr:hypothetical protein DBB30_15620 [Yersinia pestis]TNV23452.1 hypothetical protein FIO06_17310 [Yersinia pestis]TNV25037.1 hypothetical protein FID62_10145 [Yersinia pestis]